MNGICLGLGHRRESHLDYIYGSLPREHVECVRCGRTLLFEKCDAQREKQLSDGFIGDGDARGCKSIKSI